VQVAGETGNSLQESLIAPRSDRFFN